MPGVDSKVLPDVHTGCAGWSVSGKVADQFPGEGTHLARYARVFSCVEINSSFYRPHQPKTYCRWAESVPDSFRFSVKVPRTITHEHRLVDCDSLLDAFMDQVGHLGQKLGYLLIQLPPSLRWDARTAARFLGAMRDRTDVPLAVEPRHASWGCEAAQVLLDDMHAVRVRAHPSAVSDDDMRGATGDDGGSAASVSASSAKAGVLQYWRLHGAPRMYYSAYDDAFLVALSDRIKCAQRDGSAVWCIFDNTAAGEAIPNALSLKSHLLRCR